LQFNGQAPFFGFADISPAAVSSPSGLQDPFTAAGAVNPFPSKPPTKDLDFNAAGYIPFGGGGVYFVDPKLRTPYVFQYNLSVQQQLASNTMLEVGYLGYSAHGLTGFIDVNPFTLGTNTRIYNAPYPDPLFSYIAEFQNISRANYNGAVVKLRRQGSMGAWGSAFFTLGYTWSHEIDNMSGFRQRNDRVPYYHPNAFRGSGDTDVRQVFTFSGGWELPFDHLWQSGPKLLTSG
jgi:hypothetical protein